MNGSQGSVRTLTAVALVSPIALYAGIRFLANVGPVPAPAAVVADVAPAAPSALNESQRRAIEWLAAFAIPDELPSPMLHPEPEAAPAVDRPAEVERVADPTFAVRTIMGAGAKGIVSINGKAYRVGGQPAPGWKVTAIDGSTKRVTVTGPEGRTLELTPAERRPTGD